MMFAALPLLLGWMGAASEPARSDRALIVAVDTVDRPEARRPNAERANALAQQLIRSERFSPGSVIVMSSESISRDRPERANVLRALATLGDVGPSDDVLIVYIGWAIESDGAVFLGLEGTDTRSRASLDLTGLNLRLLSAAAVSRARSVSYVLGTADRSPIDWSRPLTELLSVGAAGRARAERFLPGPMLEDALELMVLRSKSDPLGEVPLAQPLPEGFRPSTPMPGKTVFVASTDADSTVFLDNIPLGRAPARVGLEGLREGATILVGPTPAGVGPVGLTSAGQPVFQLARVPNAGVATVSRVVTSFVGIEEAFEGILVERCVPFGAGGYQVQSALFEAWFLLGLSRSRGPLERPTATYHASDGEIVNLDGGGPESTLGRFANLTNLRYPLSLVAVGDKWTARIVDNAANGVVPASATYELISVEPIEGVPVLMIAYQYQEQRGSRPATATGTFQVDPFSGAVLRSEIEVRNPPGADPDRVMRISMRREDRPSWSGARRR